MSQRVRTSLSLSETVVRCMDARARAGGRSRSAVAEILLRAALRAARSREIDEQIRAFYEARTPDELDEEERWVWATAEVLAPPSRRPRGRGGR
jgi:metal-responsive CopG/Arc/MetJ family transcriptional regulator